MRSSGLNISTLYVSEPEGCIRELHLPQVFRRPIVAVNLALSHIAGSKISMVSLILVNIFNACKHLSKSGHLLIGESYTDEKVLNTSLTPNLSLIGIR